MQQPDPQPTTLGPARSLSGISRPGTLYIAGPMSGIPDFNYPAFRKAAEFIRGELGYQVVNPVELDEEHGVPGVESWDAGQITKRGYAACLSRALIARCDPKVQGVVALDGWEKSTGASLEVNIAVALGRPVFEFAADDHLVLMTTASPWPEPWDAADPLTEAIRQHRATRTPSAWSEADRRLYAHLPENES